MQAAEVRPIYRLQGCRLHGLDSYAGCRGEAHMQADLGMDITVTSKNNRDSL